MVPVFDRSCAPPLDHFNVVDVCPFMWVPDAAGEFNCWPIDMYAVSWSVRFGQLLRCAHKRIVIILYNESVHGKEEQVT